MHVDFLKRLMGSVAFAPANEGGGGSAQNDEKEEQVIENNGGEGGGDGPGDKQPASRFADKGLGRFASKEGGEDDDGEKGGDKTHLSDERPKWLPEKFKSGEAMARAYADLETKLRNSGKIDPDDAVPDDATVEAYFGDGIELDASVDRLSLEMDDPGLKVAADVFKKYGVGKKTATAIVKDMFKGMNEHAPTPIDPEQELKALGPNGRAAIDGTLLWLEKLDREGKLSDEDAETAVDMMGTARGVRFLNKLRGMTGERSIPVGSHIPSSGGMSPEEWTIEMMKAQGEKDYKRQAELEKLGEAIWGTGAASGSPIRGIPEG